MAIQPKPVPGIICAYDPILLTFHFFIQLSKYGKLNAKHFQFHTKMRTPHHFDCKKVRE